MAKKKVATSESSSIPNKPVAKKSATKPAVQEGKQRLLTSDEIGQVAGEVWLSLIDAEDCTVASLKKSVGAPDALIMAAIGWLAREDKLRFDNVGRVTKVSLQ